MKQENKGFTLVELIIVIAVIGVLAAILIPVFASVIDKSNTASMKSSVKNLNTSIISEAFAKQGRTDFTEEALTVEEALALAEGAGCSKKLAESKIDNLEVVWVPQIGERIINKFAIV